MPSKRYVSLSKPKSTKNAFFSPFSLISFFFCVCETIPIFPSLRIFVYACLCFSFILPQQWTIYCLINEMEMILRLIFFFFEKYMYQTRILWKFDSKFKVYRINGKLSEAKMNGMLFEAIPVKYDRFQFK